MGHGNRRPHTKFEVSRLRNGVMKNLIVVALSYPGVLYLRTATTENGTGETMTTMITSAEQ